MQVFPAPHFLFGNALEEAFFVGKLLANALKRLRVWHVNKKGERMPLQAPLLTKVLEARRPRLNESASVNFITPASDLLHTSDRLIDSLRFIDKSSRKSKSLI